MTLDDLRALCAHDRTGWLARAVGRAPDTMRGWLRGDTMGRAAADWLDRLQAVTPAPTPERPHRVLLDVDAPAGPEPR